jgi:hypothetical protein
MVATQSQQEVESLQFKLEQEITAGLRGLETIQSLEA